MGGCSSTIDEDEREAVENTKKIDKENAKDYRVNSEKIKILTRYEYQMHMSIIQCIS
jgi:hypothetical protein